MSDQLSITDDAPVVANVPHARADDPGTSWASAVATEKEEGKTTVLKPNTAKHEALRWIVRHPRTALEVERASRARGIWKRVSDLKNAHLIEPCGTKRDQETQRDGIIWQATKRGYEVLDLLDAGETVKL